MGVENGEPCIHAATLNKLVVQLTTSATPGTLSNLYALAPCMQPKSNTSHFNADVRYMKAFLMTYLSFTNPKTLLLKLMERYHVPPSSHSPAEIKRIQLRVCNVLKNWVVQYFDDFDHELIQTVVTFVDEHLDRDGHDSITKILRNAIVKRVGDLAISDIYISIYLYVFFHLLTLLNTPDHRN